MTVVISDLVARVRAEGVQETTQQVKAVGDAAQQTARALQIMSEAAAKQSGGTPAGWMEIFTRGNVQPTAAALAQAAQEMQKTASAATQAVQPTQNLAKAAADHAAGWRLSESSMVRFGAALLGVNLGISLVAGAANQIREQIVGAVDAARELEVASRAAAGSYGPSAASALTPAAATFAADPSTRGTQAQYIEAVSGLRGLTAEYGLNLAQVQQLVTAAGQLARVQGVDLPTAAKALDEVMRGDTSAAESLGITLTDTAGRLRGVGVSYDELVTISGRTRAEQLLLASTLDQVKTQQDNTKGSTDNLAAAYDRLAKNADAARQKAGQQLSGPAAAVVGAAADLLKPPGPTPQQALEQRAGIAGYLSGGQAITESGDLLSAEEAQNRIQNLRAQDAALASRMLNEERADLLQVTSATQQNTTAVQAQLTAYESLRTSIDHTVESLGQIRNEQGQYSTLLESARGPYFPQVLGSPETVGALTAAQDQLALRAQRVAQGQADQMRAQLVQGVSAAGEIGPNAAARAQQQLDQYDRTVAARTQQVQAQHDLAINDLNLAQNQAGLTDITLRQRERELELQRETVGLRREDLQLQANVLSTSQAVTQARLGALPVENASSAFTYQQNMAQALARQRMARLLQGQDVSSLPGVDQLIQMNYRAQLGAAENAPAAVQAQRNVEVASQAQTGAQLLEQVKAGQLQAQQIAVDAANLADLPQQTDLMSQQLQLQRDQLQAQQDERDAVRKLIDIASEPPTAGAGVQSVTVNFTGPVSVRSDQDVVAIANQAASMVMDALAAPSAPTAPNDLAGARR